MDIYRLNKKIVREMGEKRKKGGKEDMGKIFCFCVKSSNDRTRSLQKQGRI